MEEQKEPKFSKEQIDYLASNENNELFQDMGKAIADLLCEKYPDNPANEILVAMARIMSVLIRTTSRRTMDSDTPASCDVIHAAFIEMVEMYLYAQQLGDECRAAPYN